MDLKIHTLGIKGSAPKMEGESSEGNIHVMIEIDGHLIEMVDRVSLVTKADEFQIAHVRLLPGEVETIVHTAESWAELLNRGKVR